MKLKNKYNEFKMVYYLFIIINLFDINNCQKLITTVGNYYLFIQKKLKLLYEIMLNKLFNYN